MASGKKTSAFYKKLGFCPDRLPIKQKSAEGEVTEGGPLYCGEFRLKKSCTTEKPKKSSSELFVLPNDSKTSDPSLPEIDTFIKQLKPAPQPVVVDDKCMCGSGLIPDRYTPMGAFGCYECITKLE